MEAQKFAGLKYAEGEVEVRTYLCSDIYSPSSKGYLTVTNKRVIFQGMSSGSRVNQETWLDGVSGIDAFYGKDINTSKIIRSIVLMIIGLIVMMAGSSSASYDGMGGWFRLRNLPDYRVTVLRTWNLTVSISISELFYFKYLFF